MTRLDSQVALSMAAGQLDQARYLLALPAAARLRGGRAGTNVLVRALEHLRSACGWLIGVAGG